MWRIEFDPGDAVLSIRLTESTTSEELRELSDAQQRAFDATRETPFRLFLDLRGLLSLDPECGRLVRELRRSASMQPGFRGCAVLAEQPTLHEREFARATNALNSPTDGHELVTVNEAEALQFLRAPW